MDDVVRLRKQHPCGGYEWRVVRIGADIGLKCTTCEHRVLLSRRDFEKRLKTFVSRGPETPAALLAAMQGDAPAAHAESSDDQPATLHSNPRSEQDA